MRADKHPLNLSNVARVHGLFYVVTGFWPLLGIRSFQAVTGAKTDLWLVKTAGSLIGVIGIVLGLAGSRRQLAPEIPILGIGSALSLAGIDLVYVRRRRISPIYLADAVLELTLAAGWLIGWLQRPAR